MKKFVCTVCVATLLFMACLFPASAQSKDDAEIEAPMETGPVPVAYTHDFDAYSNVVGTLNADGTKTAYFFATPEDVINRAESIIGIPLSPEYQPVDMVNSTNVSIAPVSDATVYSGESSLNFGAESTLCVGEHATRGYARTYIKYDLSALNGISSKNIISAYLQLDMLTTSSYAPAPVECYMVSNTWNESTIRWWNKPDYYANEKITTNIGNLFSGMTTPYTELSGSGYQLYITKAVMAWQQGFPNNGIMLKTTHDDGLKYYNSKESASTSAQVLYVTYNDITVPSGQGIVSNDSNTKYYLMSRKADVCLTATSQSVGSSMQMHAGNSNEVNLQRWRISKTSDGQFIIWLGNENVCLSNNNGSLCLGDGTPNTQNCWQIERNWNGTYRLFNDASTKKYLAISSVTNPAPCMRNYICNAEYSDEWTLIPYSPSSAARFFYFNTNATDIDTSYGMNALSNAPMYNYSPLLYLNKSAAVGYSYLSSSELFWFTGHGGPGKLYFYQPRVNGNEVETTLVVSGTGTRSLETLSANALAKQRLVYLSSCSSGANNSAHDNMTGKMYQLGSHNVSSYFTDTHFYEIDSGVPDSGAWDSVFLTELILGRNVSTAKARADRYFYELFFQYYTQYCGAYNFYELFQRHDLGDDHLRPMYNMEHQLTDNGLAYYSVPQLSFSLVRNAGNTTVFSIDEEPEAQTALFTLPMNLVDNQGESELTTFDVYKDNSGGVSWYYSGSDVLHSYEPYTQNLKLGEYNVNPSTAVAVAQSALTQMGYSVAGFDCTTSNDSSKTFVVRYTNHNNNQRLVFHLQSDAYGNVYIIDFTAWDYTLQ